MTIEAQVTRSPTDVSLMSRIAGGEVCAFEQLYDRYCDVAYGLARAVCGERGRAEDAVQEAFLSIWRGRMSYQADRGTVAAWLVTIVRYRAIDTFRRSKPQWTSDEALHAHAAPVDVAAEAVAAASARELLAMLGRLPGKQLEVIALAYYGGLSHTEIARRLELPTGTVKGRMRLGLQALRTDLNALADQPYAAGSR